MSKSNTECALLTTSSPMSPLSRSIPAAWWLSRRLQSSCTCLFRASTSSWWPASICRSRCCTASVCRVNPSSSRWLRAEGGSGGLKLGRPRNPKCRQRWWEQAPRAWRVSEPQLASDTCRLSVARSPFVRAAHCGVEGSGSGESPLHTGWRRSVEGGKALRDGRLGVLFKVLGSVEARRPCLRHDDSARVLRGGGIVKGPRLSGQTPKSSVSVSVELSKRERRFSCSMVSRPLPLLTVLRPLGGKLFGLREGLCSCIVHFSTTSSKSWLPWLRAEDASELPSSEKCPLTFASPRLLALLSWASAVSCASTLPSSERATSSFCLFRAEVLLAWSAFVSLWLSGGDSSFVASWRMFSIWPTATPTVSSASSTPSIIGNLTSPSHSPFSVPPLGNVPISPTTVCPLTLSSESGDAAPSAPVPMLSSRDLRWSCHFSFKLGSLERRLEASGFPTSQALGRLSNERVLGRLWAQDGTKLMT